MCALAKNRLQNEDSLRQQLQSSARSYDNSLLQKLNASSSDAPFSRNRGTPPRDFRATAFGSATGGSLPPLPPQWQQQQQQRSGSPRHLPSSAANSPRTTDSPFERWAQSASAGDSLAMRPRQHLSAISTSLKGYRDSGDTVSLSSSHVTDSELAESRMRRSASASILPGYDSFEDEDLQMEDTPIHVTQMKSLTIHDPRTSPHQYAQRVGSKRRASSPPNEDRLAGGSEPTRKGLLLESVGSDMYSRRTPPIHRSSPGGHHQKFYHPRSASTSFTSASVSSGVTHWSSAQYSPASSLNTDWSPSASYNQSDDMRKDVKYSQLSTGSSRSACAVRRLPEISATGNDAKDLPPILKHSPAPKMVGMFICECCPKKPKKFDNQADLQYVVPARGSASICC